MKANRVVLSSFAQRDLAEIFKYVESESPGRVKSWLDEIDRGLGRLCRLPKTGTVPKDEVLAARGYLAAEIGQCLAFYVLRRNRIEIRRLLLGKGEYSFLL